MGKTFFESLQNCKQLKCCVLTLWLKGSIGTTIKAVVGKTTAFIFMYLSEEANIGN